MALMRWVRPRICIHVSRMCADLQQRRRKSANALQFTALHTVWCRESALLLKVFVCVHTLLQSLSIAHGFSAMPPAAHARMVLQNSIVDFLVPIIAFGVMRATLSQVSWTVWGVW